MIILFDQDAVLADFDAGFERRWRQFGVCEPVPAAKRTSFDFKVDYPPKYAHLVDDLMAQQGLFRELPPIPGAIRAAHTLLAEGHDVRVCTSPPGASYRYALAEKAEWIDHHMGIDFVTRLILTHDKTLVRGDVLIDDKPDITGACVPVWRQIVVDQPYNRHLDGPRILDWNDEASWRAAIFGTPQYLERRLAYLN